MQHIIIAEYTDEEQSPIIIILVDLSVYYWSNSTRDIGLYNKMCFRFTFIFLISFQVNSQGTSWIQVRKKVQNWGLESGLLRRFEGMQ